ncbi:MAG: hypothetical protein ABIH76_08220 [Candidatus Bathyarchaeota archaeon]
MIKRSELNSLYHKFAEKLVTKFPWQETSVAAVEQQVRDFNMCPACLRCGSYHEPWCEIVRTVRGDTGWVNTNPFGPSEIVEDC